MKIKTNKPKGIKEVAKKVKNGAPKMDKSDQIEKMKGKILSLIEQNKKGAAKLPASKSKKTKGDKRQKPSFEENTLQEEDFGIVNTSDEEELSDNEDTEETHKDSLKKLKEIDPDFYKFLEQNDKKLLKFNDEDDDGEDALDELDDESDNEELNKKTHTPKGKLDVASDESDYEPSDEDEKSTRKANSITLVQLKTWQKELTSDKVSLDTIRNVMLAFNSALMSVATGNSASQGMYRVDGSAVFNGVVQMCVLHMQSAINKYLQLNTRTSKLPHKSRKWNKIRSPLRGYLIDLAGLLQHVSSQNILSVLLKHLHQMCPLIVSFSSITKPILKRMVALWSSSEETVRVLAFLCILKITRGQQATYLGVVLKAMYLSYIRNSKFVSPGTLPSINFMRRSLAEMFALDLTTSYQHVFLYIRQLAIHLRNAITLKKKESFQSVYNWQFISSLRLWGELLSATYNRPQLQPLLYPLVSIIIGVIKLISTAQFFPVRFHCAQILVQISRETGVFIPVLPLILEALKSSTLNKKHTKVSMKPIQFTCVLRLNKGQMLENGFRNEVIDNVFNLTLEYVTHESHTIAFPDLIVPCVLQLKSFVKASSNANYVRKMKQLCDKILESARFTETERNAIQFGLNESEKIAAWESKIKTRGTPLMSFYTNWVKTHQTKKRREANQVDEISDFKLPTMNKRKRKDQDSDDEGSVELFPSDSEDDLLDIEREKPEKQKAKLAKKTKSSNVVESNEEEPDEFDYLDHGVDIVKDLDLEDW